MQNSSKFTSLVILFVSICIVVFFTASFWMTLQTSLDQKTTFEEQLKAKQEEKNKLESIKKEIDSGKHPDIGKYVFDFKEDELIQYIYDFSQENNSYMSIKQVTFEAGKQDEYGFKEGKIQIDARMGGEDVLLRFLDFLVSDQSKYSFFIDTFTYPNDGLAGNFDVSIPLKVYYR